FVCVSSRRRHTRLVSDWSSDVCSSDLLIRQGEITRPGLRGVRLGDDRVSRRLNLPGVLIIDVSKGSAAEAAGLRGTWSDARGRKIGRASCRERVWVAGGDGWLKR